MSEPAPDPHSADREHAADDPVAIHEPAQSHRVRHDDQAGDAHGRPAVSGCHDARRQASLFVELAANRLAGRDVRLDFDNHDCALRGTHAQNIDRASLAVLRVGDLKLDQPTVGFEASRDPENDDGVVLVEQPFELGSLPTRCKLDASVERREQGPDRAQAQLVEPAAFGSRDGRLRHAGTRRQVRLPPSAPPPKCPDHEAARAIVHADIVPSGAQPVLTHT